MSVKMMIQITSTKCQYRPIISTVSDLLPGTLERFIMPTMDISMMIPTVTCTPWKPVRTKKLDENKRAREAAIQKKQIEEEKVK